VALPEIADKYQSGKNFGLLENAGDPPLLLQKPFDSFVLKTYRSNILH
jgi:hypothetical protein